MIECIEGALGAGKGMYCMDSIVDDLRHSNCFITVNDKFGLKLKDMQRLLLEKYEDDFDMFERIRILTTEETFKFWHHPALNFEITERIIVSDGERKKGWEKGNVSVSRPDYSTLTPANGWRHTKIYIDEAPEFFDASNWTEIGDDCKHFLRHSRKLGMDVIFVCQDRMQIAKPLRLFFQQTVVLRNLGYESIGIFRAPGKLFWRRYFKTPDVSPKPMASGLRSIQPSWLGQMYDTAAGVGMAGGGSADKQRRKKGLHPVFLIACVVLLALVMMAIPRLISYGSRRMVASNVTNNPPAHVSLPIVPLVQPTVLNQVASQPLVQSSIVEVQTNETHLTGYIIDPSTKMWTILLSDGTSHFLTIKQVVFIDRETVSFGGKSYTMQHAQNMDYGFSKVGDPAGGYARVTPYSQSVAPLRIQRPLRIKTRDGLAYVTHPYND